MAFMQISENDANRFVEFLLGSGAWAKAPAGQWESHRLVKVRKTEPIEPFHSPLDTVVIHKNKKGVHSFDPLHVRAYEHSTMSLSPPLEALHEDLMEPLRPAGHVSAFIRGLKNCLQAFSKDYHIEKIVESDGVAFVTFSVPATMLRGSREKS